jgi:hypothetical protein
VTEPDWTEAERAEALSYQIRARGRVSWYDCLCWAREADKGEIERRLGQVQDYGQWWPREEDYLAAVAQPVLLEKFLRSVLAESPLVPDPPKPGKAEYEDRARAIVSDLGDTQESGWERVAVDAFLRGQASLGDAGWDRDRLVAAVIAAHEESLAEEEVPASHRPGERYWLPRSGRCKPGPTVVVSAT